MRSRVSGVLQSFLGDLDVVEGNHTFPGHLMFLVALTRDKNDVPCLGIVYSQLDSLMPVRLQRVAGAGALQPWQRVVHDGDGVFTARVVAGQNYEVAASSCGFAHQRPLGAIAIAATSEDGDHASRPTPLIEEIVGHCREVADSVVGVGIVYDHSERLA